MHAVFTLAALSGLAAAANHQVQVGPSGAELTFDPATISAKKGDTVQFIWNGEDHSVTQGDPNNGCAPSGASAFNSGSIENGSWTITVNNTDPIYYYCAVRRHCQMGMVGGINLPSDSAFDSYKSKCASASRNVLPAGAQGGSNGAPSAGSNSASSSSSSSSAASSSSSVSRSSSSSSSRATTTASTRTGTSAAVTGSVTSTSTRATSATTSTGTSTGAAVATHIAGVLAGLPFALAALL